MSNGSELKSPAAQALRAAGFVPLPRLWVTQAQMDEIANTARQNADTVNAIRAKAVENIRKQQEIEAAWEELNVGDRDQTWRPK